jgi:hypothetical protein
MARSPAAISSLSRARNGLRKVLAPTETAASTNARAVIDFDPGKAIVACIGSDAVGATHGAGLRVGRAVVMSASCCQHRAIGTRAIDTRAIDTRAIGTRAIHTRAVNSGRLIAVHVQRRHPYILRQLIRV